MSYPIRPFTEGMIPEPMTATHAASYEAARASRKACDAVFCRGGSIEEASAASLAAYDAHMSAAIAKATTL